MIDFSKDLALSLLESEEKYPVDLDKAWGWLGYNQKSDCLTKLKNNFEEGEDFSVKGLKPSTGGRPCKKIFLTVDCFEKMKTHQELRKTKENHERIIQHKLYSRRGGQTEVSTPVGNIDLLTSSEIIEIKDKKDWKSALGQVLAYSYYYPSHRKVICLFGYAHSSYKETVKNVCDKYDVFIEWINN